MADFVKKNDEIKADEAKGIDALAKMIGESENIVFFGGAGVSTESGIPDFRSETGLYSAQKEYGYSPEEIISASFFARDPETFFKYYKQNMIYRDVKPNIAHRAISELEQRGKIKAVVTQNIDGLHQLAGSKTVFELHGSVLKNTCMQCGAHYDLGYIMDEANCISKDGIQSSIPFCSVCGGIVKPDVVLYEEGLDQEVVTGAVNAIEKADTLIVGGTSLVVYPAAGFLNYFRGKSLVLINKGATPYDSKAQLVLRMSIGDVFGGVMDVI